MFAIGGSTTLTLTAFGDTTYASINGTGVAVPVGQATTTPEEPGEYTAVGVVEGPGGTGECSVSFQVDTDN